MRYAASAYSPTEFDWDDDKDEVVRAVRGFGFADAIGIFLGRTVEWQDMRDCGGETRMIAVGECDGDFYTLVYTDRGTVRRITTAWSSDREERMSWQR